METDTSGNLSQLTGLQPLGRSGAKPSSSSTCNITGASHSTFPNMPVFDPRKGPSKSQKRQSEAADKEEGEENPTLNSPNSKKNRLDNSQKSEPQQAEEAGDAGSKGS